MQRVEQMSTWVRTDDCPPDVILESWGGPDRVLVCYHDEAGEHRVTFSEAVSRGWYVSRIRLRES